MTKICFLDRDSIHPDIRIREPDFAHQWTSHPHTTAEQVIEHCGNNDIILTNKVAINRATIDACPNIKHIAVTATGYNIIDLEACHERGISVSNIQGYSINSVSEHALALTMALKRQLINYRRAVINGKWEQSTQFCFFEEPIHDLKNTTLGIIGFGSLGQATAKLMHAVGMNVIYTTRSEKNCNFATQVDMPTLLKTADVISLHCPLTDDTRNLFNDAAFEQMKESAILINLARGGIVDEEALVKAIKEKKIAATATDVFVQEPPRPGSSPLMEIAEQDNVIITPHVGWASMEAMQFLADILIDNIEGFYHGEPQNIVA